MAAGAKSSPRGEAKGCAGVKVDISMQTAINPAKAFLSLPINFFSFHKPYTLYFLHLSEKGKPASKHVVVFHHSVGANPRRT